MANTTNRHYLVLSDMHFGTPQSSVNNDRYRDALITHIVNGAPWEKIILTGDLLDLNLSTFTRAIEGVSPPHESPLCGFRSFLAQLHRTMATQEKSKGLRDVANAWIYVPGNHDYKIWDMLSARVVCEDVLSQGKPLGFIPTPLMRFTWQGTRSFFAGIFLPFEAEEQVIVDYPYHAFNLGPNAEQAVFTHGHYLERSETRGAELANCLSANKTPAENQKALRNLFIRTAQFQTLASAVSFTRDTRYLIDLICGPGSVLNKIRAWIIQPIFPTIRGGDAISEAHLRNIDAYLKYFCGFTTPTRWFVFGHTHRQDKVTSHRPEVFNVGSCYDDHGMPITFLQIEERAGQDPDFRLMCIDQHAVARPSR